MIELISEEKIISCDYLRIRCEFYDIWNKLFLNKNKIDQAIFSRFKQYWFMAKALSPTRLGNNRFITMYNGEPLTSEIILRSNQLWMPRCWEYPWAILNANLEPDTRILDIGSGWSLFSLYLAQKGGRVDSIDTDERQMKIMAPVLANILKLKVNYFVDDALNLSARENAYDCVFAISVLEHFEEEVENGIIINKHAKRLDRAAIREFIRVIKPGGRIILTLDYGNHDTCPRSFYFDYVRDLIDEFRNNLLEPIDKFDKIRFTRDKEEEMKRLWSEFFPYDSGNPPGGALGIVLTKH